MKKRQPHPWLDKQCSLVVMGKHSESYFLGLSPCSVSSTNVKVNSLALSFLICKIRIQYSIVKSG